MGGRIMGGSRERDKRGRIVEEERT